MATLHIEHPVTDFGTWQAAFDRFAQVREESGVRGHRILRLDFPTVGQAERFLGFLRTKGWTSPDNVPPWPARRRPGSSNPPARHRDEGRAGLSGDQAGDTARARPRPRPPR